MILVMNLIDVHVPITICVVFNPYIVARCFKEILLVNIYLDCELN